MLQPRRLAARAAAHRMATTLGDSVGETVGYRMRLDTKVGAQDQNRSSHGRRPAVACSRAILRSALTRSSSSMNFTSGASQTDTGLALCLESQRLFRRISASLADCRPCWTVDRSRISWAGARNRLRRPALSFRGDIATLDQPLSGHLDGGSRTINPALARAGSSAVFWFFCQAWQRFVASNESFSI